MIQKVLAELSVSVSELKKNPSALIHKADGEPIAVLNHNKPAAYLIPAATYEALMEAVEDYELGELVKRRLAEGEKPISVNLDDL